MNVYYNDNDPYCAQWLRNLIAAGHLPAGEVDERPIQSVTADDVGQFRQCHFFAGIGGWPLALKLAGWPDEREVWTGSCPCQPFSVAGQRRGILDERHLWPTFAKLIRDCKPPIVFGEQVASKDGRAWLAGVRADLEVFGYAVGAADLCAASVGAPHIRQRLYWVAEADSDPKGVGHTAGESLRRRGQPWEPSTAIRCDDGSRRVGAGTLAVAHGIPNRVGKLRGYGNAIVPQVAQAFIESVMECMP